MVLGEDTLLYPMYAPVIPGAVWLRESLVILFSLCSIIPPSGYPGHDLRGGSLDHEQHDMSETRETANADMYQAIPRLAGNTASRKAE
jgi:hypothetical protein